MGHTNKVDFVKMVTGSGTIPPCVWLTEFTAAVVNFSFEKNGCIYGHSCLICNISAGVTATLVKI